MKKADYRYNLVMTRKGMVSIENITEGTEVMCFGKWKPAPKPVMGKIIIYEFDTLPATAFERETALYRREVSVSHKIILGECEPEPELAIRGFFRETRTPRIRNGVNVATTTFAGIESLSYWLPKFIAYYGEPIMPGLTAVGYNFYHHFKEMVKLRDNEISECNLEYILEGMLRKNFCWANKKFLITPVTSWNETHRIMLRLLDIECDAHKDSAAIRNPVNLLRHIRDDYTKSKITDEAIAYCLKKSCELPEYTSGIRIVRKTEGEDWILPGINPDINGINPENCHTEGFTTSSRILWADDIPDGRVDKMRNTPKLEGNYWKILENEKSSRF